MIYKPKGLYRRGGRHIQKCTVLVNIKYWLVRSLEIFKSKLMEKYNWNLFINQKVNIGEGQIQECLWIKNSAWFMFVLILIVPKINYKNTNHIKQKYSEREKK